MPLRAARPATALYAKHTAAACAVMTCAFLGYAPGSALAAHGIGLRQATSSCPNAAPPPPVDTSEVPQPGAASPEPLPVPQSTVGGDQLGRCETVTAPGVPQPPADVTAGTWIVADLDSGAVLAAKNPHGRQRPASTMKTLTALLAVRELKMDDTITGTQEDADQEGSKVGLQPGVTYTVRDVLNALVEESGNDAAHALAMKLGGMQVALGKMNSLAVHLGALDTRAATPSGLDGPGMSTSAYDLALIFRAALHNPDFATIATTKHVELPNQPGQPPMQVSTDNEVVRDYPGILGAKNGFTDDAQHTFVAAAERNGHRIVTVLMHGEAQLNNQATRLLDYGFDLGNARPIGQLVPEQTASAVAHPPIPKNVPPNQPKPNPPSEMFGTIGGPLTLLATAGVAALGFLGFRRRRAKLDAAARRDNARLSDDRS